MSTATHRLGYMLKHAFVRLAELTDTALEPHGIDGRDLAVLTVVGEDGPLSQQDVVRELDVDRTTMVVLIDDLEDRGLVHRRPHPDDRRKNIVELTDHGRAIVDAATPVSDATERRFLAELSDTDVQQLRTVLCTLVHGRGTAH